jgi:type I restriction enzyme S subunit
LQTGIDLKSYETALDGQIIKAIRRNCYEVIVTLKTVNQGDIVLTKGGSIARVGLITKKAAISRDLIFINSSQLAEQDYIFLFLYFQTHFFNTLLVRSSSQSVQPHLTILQVRNLDLFKASNEFKQNLLAITKLAFAKREESKTLYTQAESLLLQELGLDNWQPPKEAVAIKNFSASFGATGRLDAEYYQPKYEQALIALHQSGYPVKQLGLLIEPIRNGFDFREFTEEGTPYIRVGDIKRGQIEIDNAVKIPLVQENLKKSSIKLKIDDILFTRKGSFGNVAVVTDKEIHTIISSEIMLLRLISDSLLPEYLTLFLNSQFGYLQIEQRVHGIAYYSISQEDLAEIEIVILPISKQKRIVKKIHSSFILKEESKILLETAKQAVELAIEQGEETAMAKLST